MPRAPRLDSLTGLRWWAAFGVFTFHMTNLAPLPIAGALGYGNFGVMFFFVLSGFVLTWSASPTVSPQTFWWRRFARIYPAHFVALLIAIPVFYSFAPDPAQTWVKPVDVGLLLLSFVLLQGWSKDPAILFSGNPAAWTLTCEAFFYALHPALNRVLRLLSLRKTFVAALAIVGLTFALRVAILLWPDSPVTEVPYPISRISEFALGMCAAHALRLGWRPRIRPLVMYLVGAGFIGWNLYSPQYFAGGQIGAAVRASVNEWLIILCVLLIVAVAVRDISGGRSLLRSLPLVRLGEWSYSFYLVHATLIYSVLAIVGRRETGWSNLIWYAGMLVISIAAAAALHYFVEKPCERYLRAAWDRRLVRRAAAAEAERGTAGAAGT